MYAAVVTLLMAMPSISQTTRHPMDVGTGTGAELEKGVTQPGDQGRLELTLSNSPGQPEEVEHIRVLGNLRGQFGVVAGQCELEGWTARRLLARVPGP
jgi:hypothetical protein